MSRGEYAARTDTRRTRWTRRDRHVDRRSARAVRGSRSCLVDRSSRPPARHAQCRILGRRARSADRLRGAARALSSAGFYRGFSALRRGPNSHIWSGSIRMVSDPPAVVDEATRAARWAARRVANPSRHADRRGRRARRRRRDRNRPRRVGRRQQLGLTDERNTTFTFGVDARRPPPPRPPLPVPRSRRSSSRKSCRSRRFRPTG